MPQADAPKWLTAALIPLVFSWGRPDRADWLVIGFVGWLACSLYWSADHLAGIDALWRWAVLGAAFITLRRVDVNLPMLACMAVWACVTMELTGYARYGGHGNENFIAEFVLIAAPVCWLWGRLGKLTTFGCVAYLLWNDSNVELAFIAVAAVVVLIVTGARSKQDAIIAGLLGAVLAGMIAYGWHEVFISLSYRINLAMTAGAMWLDSPVIGQGMGSYATLYQGFASDIGRSPIEGPIIYVNSAHNELAEIAAEAGLIGIALLGLLIWQLRCGYSMYAVALVAALAASLVSFPLHNAPTAVLIVAIAAQLCRKEQRAGYWTLPLALVSAVALFLSVQVIRAQHEFALMIANVGVNNNAAFVHNVNAYQIYPFDRRTRFQLFPSVMGISGQLGHEAVDRIYAISQHAVRDHPGVLTARLKYLVETERCDRECIDLARHLSCEYGDIYEVYTYVRAEC